MTPNYDPIHAAFTAALKDHTGASDEAFCLEMWKRFVVIFEEELGKELASREKGNG